MIEPMLHIISRDEWSLVRELGLPYRQPGFEQSGFTHLSTRSLVLTAAARFYADRDDLVLLVIDPRRLSAEVRWEAGVAPDHDKRFPHLYGPMELDAVVAVVDFPVTADGGFELPPLPPLPSLDD